VEVWADTAALTFPFALSSDVLMPHQKIIS
jgi:hypothetical protein